MSAQEFQPGTKLTLENNHSLEIIETLGEGGQGTVYRVRIDNTEYALKWYHPGCLKNPDAFYANLVDNIKLGAPNPAFLWPEFITKKANGSFGYIMKLRPSNFRDFSDFLLNRANFKSLSCVIQAALNICNGFRDLHRKGYSYQDLNDGNFFIDPDNGDVLICDNDNVAPYGVSLGIAGKARYMAPEVVRNIRRPDDKTDRFSLAVILFRLLFLDHPLEGEKVHRVPCLTEDFELRFYGKEPVFIFDPDDESNRPVPNIDKNVLRLWPLYPAFLRDAFVREFSKDCMTGARNRQTDNEWQIALTNLRSCVVVCPKCGEETFVLQEGCQCVNCHADFPKQRILESEDGKYQVILFPGNKLYRCHVDAESDDYREICGEVVTNPQKPGMWGIRNLTNDTWNFEGLDGSISQIQPNRAYPITRIKRIMFSSDCEANIVY